MTQTILFAGRLDHWQEYERELGRACKAAGVEANVSPNHPADEVDYIIFAPDGPISDFTPFKKLKAVFSLWAGVEKVVSNPTLQVPLTRMVDLGLSQGMCEWVTGHVLRYHLGMDIDILRRDAVWHPHVPPLSHERTVGILGMGALGQGCARSLNGLGFTVLGWSRNPKAVEGVECFSGEKGLKQVLAKSQILVLLLPDTKSTHNVLNDQSLALMPKGAFILNPGRGTLIDDEALLRALDTGQIAHATLDVFRNEPLPPNHPFWSHKGVTVTPHIAAATRAKSASDIIAENLRRAKTGEPFLYLVDRISGY